MNPFEFWIPHRALSEFRRINGRDPEVGDIIRNVYGKDWEIREVIQDAITNDL